MFEINLVPDIKAEMIHAQKMRNLLYFVCFVVAAASVGAVLFLVAIKTGQDIRMSSQDNSLKLMSEKIEEYDGLSEVLTVQDQLNKLNLISSRKKVLSRVFNILNTLRPTGNDRIMLSSLEVDLDNSSLSFEAQAYAGEEPRINYRVLEAFQKSIPLMRYDYGRYVNKDGFNIPTRCIIEAENGNTLTEKGNSILEGSSMYALWTKGVQGCDPSRDDSEKTDVSSDDSTMSSEEDTTETAVDNTETEKIWRTPQKDWIDDGYMTSDGAISNVPHFVSSCIVYRGVDTNGSLKWTSENNCELAPGGIQIGQSTDAIETGGDRVLRFSAVISLNEEVFKFANKHMLAIAPAGKTNVTDSYIQIGGMFTERAKECGEAGCN